MVVHSTHTHTLTHNTIRYNMAHCYSVFVRFASCVCVCFSCHSCCYRAHLCLSGIQIFYLYIFSTLLLTWLTSSVFIVVLPPSQTHKYQNIVLSWIYTYKCMYPRQFSICTDPCLIFFMEHSQAHTGWCCMRALIWLDGIDNEITSVQLCQCQWLAMWKISVDQKSNEWCARFYHIKSPIERGASHPAHHALAFSFTLSLFLRGDFALNWQPFTTYVSHIYV